VILDTDTDTNIGMMLAGKNILPLWRQGALNGI